MKTIKFTLAFLAAGLMLMNTGIGQMNNDSLIARKAIQSLRKANIMNGITIGFGMASNIEMIIIGGFPLEVDDGLNAGMNLSHAVFGIGRFTTSIFPPIHVAKARKTLEPWRNSPEMAASCKRLFASLDAAQVLSAAAPVLCILGGSMMIAASFKHEHLYDVNYNETTTTSKPGLKTAGWIFVGAGLISSFSSAILISNARHELSKKTGTFKMSAGPDGLGIKYNLPVQF